MSMVRKPAASEEVIAGSFAGRLRRKWLTRDYQSAAGIMRFRIIERLIP
jgi:hypothetical protein